MESVLKTDHRRYSLKQRFATIESRHVTTCIYKVNMHVLYARLTYDESKRSLSLRCKGDVHNEVHHIKMSARGTLHGVLEMHGYAYGRDQT